MSSPYTSASRPGEASSAIDELGASSTDSEQFSPATVEAVQLILQNQSYQRIIVKVRPHEDFKKSIAVVAQNAKRHEGAVRILSAIPDATISSIISAIMALTTDLDLVALLRICLKGELPFLTAFKALSADELSDCRTLVNAEIHGQLKMLCTHV